MGSRLEKNADAVRKRIESHTFQDEGGDEYGASKFGGFEDYFRRKKIKLQNRDVEIRSSAPGKPQIFKGIVTHVNGYTQPSLNDIHMLVVSHGGGFMQYLDGKTTVTHIIAANLTPKKAVEFRQYRIVKPAWIVDSVNAGKLLPWNAYRVIDEGVSQRRLAFDEGKVVSQASTQKKGYRDQTDTSWYTSQVQKVVEDIDDDDGARFPGSQGLAKSMMGDYFGHQRNQPDGNTQDTFLKATNDEDDLPDSSAGFEVTSSLEDVFNQVVTEEPSVPVMSPSPSRNDVEKLRGTPSHFDRIDSMLCPEPTELTSLEKVLERNPLKRLTDETSPTKNNKPLTAEEHNAILLADPHIRKSSTGNPEFLRQYYSESRLHHLSTWKADLKSRFQQMASERSASQKPQKRKPGSRRYVMHVDFDSFFCAVSLKNAPEYIDRPAVVAHGSGNGSEIASCNYAARAFGVKNGMWMKTALTLCDNIKVLPYDFPAYEDASKEFYEAIIDVGGIVQSVSVDEALIDITALCISAGGSDGFGVSEESSWREQEKADEIADKLRKVIKGKTGCAVSIGIGGNILQAKVALRKAKPAGQYQLKSEDVLNFIGELNVTELPGVAHSIGGKLEELGIKLVKDIRQVTKERLTTVLGPKTGEKLWEYARGIDNTEVGEQVVRKSVSAEVNWGIRFVSQAEAEEFVQNMCVELQRRLIDQKVKGRQLTMKIMKKSADAPLDPPKNLGHGKCDTYNKSIVLGVATNSAEVTGREAISILRSYGFSPGELRGLGIQMTKLEPLKGTGGPIDGSQRKINFGKSSITKTVASFEDPIDDPVTPKKSKHLAPMIGSLSRSDPIDEAARQKLKPVSGHLKDWDPIDDINSPKKTKSTPIHPAAAITRANAADKSAKKFLNLTGTQFILPSQVDPSVLAELPPDIRSKLLAQGKNRPISKFLAGSIKPKPERAGQSSKEFSTSDSMPSQFDPDVFDALPEDMKAELLEARLGQAKSHQTSRIQSPVIESRQQSPASSAPQNRVSAPLEFDPGVFAALPDDMKAEILASYSVPTPLTPRKLKAAPPSKKWTPTKRRGRPAGSKNRREDPFTSLTQSNFVAPTREALAESDDSEIDDLLDEEFLAALPEDVRTEVMAEHRRKQMGKKGALATAVLRKRIRPPDLAHVGSRRLRLPAREPKPTFTTQELSTVEELRETVGVWYREFADEGPNWEDVGAMERYLRRVIVDEGNMEKAVAVVKWLVWLVDNGADNSHNGTKAWNEALINLKEKVQLAVEGRGLGRISL